jgi:3-methylfumaryl-CoA hydratase
VTGLEEWLRGWSPEAQRSSGQITGWSVGAFARCLDQPDPTQHAAVAPPLWHLFGFLPHPTQAELGADGHPAEGPFMPPIPHRRRMFAGGRLRVEQELPVDRAIDRTAAVTSVRVTSGRSGELAFVTVRTEYAVDGNPPLVVEEQDLVYRSQPDSAPGPAQSTGSRPSAPANADGEPEQPADHEITIVPDPTLLFRFSALTYNAHRIHYDEAYATGVEGHQGLVVQGPLLALLALELPRRHRPDARVVEFDYRLRRPAYAGSPVRAIARIADGWEFEVGVPGAPPSLTATARIEPV